MSKRKAGEMDGEDGPSTSGPASLGQQTAHIRNKQVRSERYHKLKHEAKKKKKVERKRRQAEDARAEELGLPPPERQQQKVRRGRDCCYFPTATAPLPCILTFMHRFCIFMGQNHTHSMMSCHPSDVHPPVYTSRGSPPLALCFTHYDNSCKQQHLHDASTLMPFPLKHACVQTIENQREKDVTAVAPDDEEVAADEEQDEFAEHFDCSRLPNVLLTTCYKPSKVMFKFITEMLEVLPAATYYKRSGFPLKKIIEYASNRGFTDLAVFNEDRKNINGLLLVHLPNGPTAQFRLSNLVLSKEIKGHGRASTHKPELVLNNFDTRLGRRVGRMFASLFAQDPTFKGRRVVTFHNQRDFVFFRHHRYIFEEKAVKGSKAAKQAPEVAVKARLQELGPRFTLKLHSLQKGTMDSKGGEFEWVRKSDMDTSRRKFHM